MAAHSRRYTLAAASLLSLVVTGCSGGKESKPPAQLASISIAPQDRTIEAGETLQLTATATYSDGSSAALADGVTWSSSAQSVATITPAGRVTGVATATARATITATYEGRSDSTTVEVAYLLKSIAIDEDAASVPVGFEHTFTVTGTYSGGATAPITSDITWASTQEASITAAGVATGLSAGVATVTATHGGLSDTAALTVSSATLKALTVRPGTATLATGQAVQLEVTGTFDDQTALPLTSGITWSDDGSGHASVSAAGLVTAAKPANPGNTVVRATHVSGVWGEATVTASPAEVRSIAITSDEAPPYAIAEGRSLRFTATAKMSDDTTMVLAGGGWTVTPSDGSVAAVDASGLATGVGPGTATLRYTDVASGVFGEATLEVTEKVIESIAVTPETVDKPKGLTQQFTAVATYSDRTTGDVTSAVAWSCPDPDPKKASVATTGVATALAEGVATIRATDPATGASGEATLTITAPELQAVSVAPATVTVPAGVAQEFDAVARFTDGDHPLARDAVTWAGGGAVIADGVASSTTPGTYTITATYQGVSGSATLTVGPPAVASVSVTPSEATIDEGGTQTFSADVLWTDQSRTSAVAWQSSRPGVATIDSAGVATGVHGGTTTITASLGGKSASAALTVNGGPPQSLQLTPAQAVVYVGGPDLQLEATGHYAAGDSMVLTSDVSWSAAPDGAIAVSASGLVTPLAAGDAVVRAEYLGVSGESYLWVGERRSVETLPLSAAALAGTLGTSRLYEITGLTPGQDYEVALTSATGTVDLFVMLDAQLQLGVPCPPPAEAGAGRSCVAAPIDTSLFVVVRAPEGTPTFTLNVVAIDGGPSTPPVTATLAFPSSFAGGYASTLEGPAAFYAVTGLAEGETYTLGLSELSANLDVAVHAVVDGQSGVLAWSDAAGTAAESVTFVVPTGAAVYVEVHNADFEQTPTAGFRLTLGQ